jgi:Protein phosphatase 2C
VVGVQTGAFLKADEMLYDLVVTERKMEDSGSTALAALVHGCQLFIANAGDSRAVLCRRGRPIELSTDHKAVAVTEADRIVAEGNRALCRPSVDRPQLTCPLFLTIMYIQGMRIQVFCCHPNHDSLEFTSPLFYPSCIF